MFNGCGAARPSQYYQLTVPAKSTWVNVAPYRVTLLIGPITASHFFRDDRIVYTSTGQAMGTYEYHRWGAPPPEMIEDVLLQELQASGRYQHVYAESSDVRGRYLLRGRLYDFSEVDASPLAARVAFHFEVFDAQAGTTVWSWSYSHDERVHGKDVAAFAAAIDRNVQSGLREIMGGLDQFFSTTASQKSRRP
jgi:ABC-type uncharacterized transport system auxiliary subunit